MAETNFLGMTFPDENDDPYYEKIAAFFQQQDAQLYSMIATGQPLLGGGVKTLITQQISPPLGIFTWTAPFEILIPGSGIYMQIPFGPDQANPSIQLVDGDRVIVNVPNISTGPMTGFLGKVNGKLIPSTSDLQGLFTVGIYRGGKFYGNFPTILT